MQIFLHQDCCNLASRHPSKTIQETGGRPRKGQRVDGKSLSLFLFGLHPFPCNYGERTLSSPRTCNITTTAAVAIGHTVQKRSRYLYDVRHPFIYLLLMMIVILIDKYKYLRRQLLKKDLPPVISPFIVVSALSLSSHICHIWSILTSRGHQRSSRRRLHFLK